MRCQLEPAHVGPQIDAMVFGKPEPEHSNLLQEFQVSLQAFTAQRAELLAMLKPLPPEAWSRMAMATGAGKPSERTMHTYAQWLANHERSHIKQIERIVTTLRM